MIGTISISEHSLFADPPRVVTVSAATATEILPNEQGVDTTLIAYRYIQNTGSNPLYYSFGLKGAAGVAVCDATANYHGYLPAGAQLDCSNQRLRVCVYSTLGTTVATTIIRRKGY